MMLALKCPHRGEFTEEIRDYGEFCKYRHVCQTNSESLPLKQTNMMSEKKIVALVNEQCDFTKKYTVDYNGAGTVVF